MRDATKPDDIRKLLNKSLAQAPARVILGDDSHHLISPAQRACWFAGTLAFLCLTALYSYMADRDQAAHIADLKERELSRVLARASCNPPDAPLEKLVGPMATQVGDSLVSIECVYVTGDLGVVPQLRYAKALVAEASK